MPLSRAAVLLPLLALGCAADRGEEAAEAMRQALASARGSLAVAGGAPAPRHEAPAATPQPLAVAARGAAPPMAAAALAGTRADQVRRVLGEPALRRPEGGAEIWLYEAPNCRLDVILYPEAGALVVAHASARAHGAAAGMTEADCLSAISATTGAARRA